MEEKKRKFTDAQNEVFGNIFGELKKQADPNFEAQAHAVIEMDDENFTTIYRDTKTEIVGTESELELITSRAKYLEL